MYHGIIITRYGFEELLNAVNLLKNKIPGLELRIYGTGEDLPIFLEMVKKFNLENIVKYFGHVSIEKIVEIIPECDVGIIPNRLTPFTKINFPTRIFEYLHMKKPVVVPRTQGSMIILMKVQSFILMQVMQKIWRTRPRRAGHRPDGADS